MKKKAALLLIAAAAVCAAVIWWLQAPRSTTVPLAVVNLGAEPVELELYGRGLQQPVGSGALSSQQKAVLQLNLTGDGELRLRATSMRASVDAVLLARASELRDQPLRLEVRDGTRFVLMPLSPE